MATALFTAFGTIVAAAALVDVSASLMSFPTVAAFTTNSARSRLAVDPDAR